MSLGKWLTNIQDNSHSYGCPKSTGYMGVSASPQLCHICDAAYWRDREKGPPAPSHAFSSSALAQAAGQAGVYEKLPGPPGVFAAGFSLPPPPVLTAASLFGSHSHTIFGRAGASTLSFGNGPAQDLEFKIVDTPVKENPCNCSSRDLLTFGHRKECGRKAPIDRV